MARFCVANKHLYLQAEIQIDTGDTPSVSPFAEQLDHWIAAVNAQLFPWKGTRSIPVTGK